MNLLFITADQQRWDSLPCYGLDFMQTPYLDRLAREGMVFERCYVPARNGSQERISAEDKPLSDTAHQRETYYCGA